MSWRHFADWAKRKQLTLRLADRLGRSRGRLAFLNHLHPPPRAAIRPDLAGWEEASLAAVWLGHATVLLRIGGMTILTDPVLSNRVGVGLGLVTGGPRRLVAPALSIAQLPRLDLILISHAHFDHLDRPTLARLPKRTPVITAAHTGDLIRDLGYRRVAELDWGASHAIGGVRVTAHPAAHWGARTFYDNHRGFNAYLVESAHAPGRRLLFGGDTAFHDDWSGVGKVDLAILGIGSYDPYVAAHATPEQAWAMAGHVEADHILPIHHGTFRLGHEPPDEPMRRMLAAAGDQASRVVGRAVGETWRMRG